MALDGIYSFGNAKNAFLREEGVSRGLTEGAHVSERRLLVVSHSPSVAFADSSLPEGALGLLICANNSILLQFFSTITNHYA